MQWYVKYQTIKATCSNTNSWSGQYLMHVQGNITQAVAAMDSCFGLLRPPKVDARVCHFNAFVCYINLLTH